MPPDEAASPDVRQIIAGWFRERHRYSAWRPRGTEDWLLVYTVSGQGRFGYSDGEMIARRGDLVLLRPGTLHDYGLEPARRRWELLWTHFHPRPHWMDWLGWPAVAPGLMRLQMESRKDRRRIQRRFVDVVTSANEPGSRREDHAMNALEKLLLICDSLNPVLQHGAIDPRIQLTIDHICQNPAAVLTLSSLADVAGISVSRFAHLFREDVGTTPQRFVEVQRINRARQLLELTAMSIKEIAVEVGYDNPFYFSLRFKHHLRQSPRGYRRSCTS